MLNWYFQMDYKSFFQVPYNLPGIKICIVYETDKTQLLEPENATGKAVLNSSRRE
jgi:hypothetical protein